MVSHKTHDSSPEVQARVGPHLVVDGKAGHYVGMTGLSPEEGLANHKAGKKSAGVVKRFGVRLVPRLYAHLNPMTYQEAVEAEPRLAEELRARGYQVFGEH